MAALAAVLAGGCGKGSGEECREYPSFQVKSHHLDTNHHVNNGQYILIAIRN